MRDEEGRTQHIHEEQLHESARIAVRWARTHRVSREVSAAPSPLARLESCRERLARAHERFQQQADEGGALSVAGEWLLDNYYVILQAFRLVREDLPEGYYKRLPKLAEGEFSGHPRVYALAREIVAYTGGRLSDQILRELLRAYQAEQPLTMGEIWALPTMLRVALLELLAASVDPGGERASGVEAIPGTVPSDLLAEQMISRYVPSLHQLATLDWDAFFDAVSLVEEVLCEDPDGSYARMEFDSRDRYRKVIEELALRSEAEELQVAQAAIELAKAHGSSSAGPTRQRHVGYYLVDEGRAKLEGVIRYRLAPFQRFVRLLGRHRLALYLGSIGMVAALVLVALLFSAQSWQSSIGQLLVLALLAAVPALGLAVNLVNVVVTRVLPPRVLPKLDLSEGVPAEFRTMVVIPGLLGDERDVDELLQQIELHYLSSRDANLGYALLTDFPDAPQETMPGDEVLIERAVSGIRALNERYPREGANPFYLFHRKRLWNPAENVWMGWERKRGKLEEFNKLLLGQGDTSFAIQIGDLSFLSQVRYVITLDADTVLPRDTASRLIGALAHPLNRAVFSPDGRRVIAGYTVLQPRAEIKPTTASRSLFTDVFSGDIGIDLYTRAVSDPYQDLFGEGIFVGKGIYDVAAFTRSLEGRVPENALLSHDLFEGIHGRAGLVTDVLLYEDYPPNYLAYAHRLHRWVRGDWQLLPWLGRRVPSREGGKRPNDLSALDRWKILDNLRRSLHQPMMLLLLVVGWLWLPGSPLFWTLASLALWGLPTLWALLEGLVQHALGRAGLGRAVRQALRTLLFIVLIPYEALLMTDAIISTLIRLYITRRKLLQWTTAAHTVRLFGGERQVAVLWGQMKGALFLSLGIAVLIAILRPLSLVVAAPFLLVWCLSPQIVYVIERPRRIKRQELNANEIEELRRLARRTWLYFERFVGPEDNWLPPDHFQEDPRGLVAHRTSPTNIGLLLMSTLGAYDLGYMGIMELELRLDSTLGSLQQMRRHRGHLLNWYNTETLEPLPPLYVSTVDSGNLAASLLVVARGLEELGRVPVFRWQEMRGLLDALGVLHEVVEAARGEATGGGVRSLAELLEEVHRELVSVRDEPSAWVELLARLADDVWHQVEERLRELIESQGRDLGVGTLRDLRTWAERVHRHMHTLENEVGILQPWLFLLPAAPSWLDSETGEVAARWRALRAVLPQSCLLEELPNICTVARERLGELLVALGTENDGLEGHQEVREWGEQLAEELETARRVAQGLLNDARALAEQMNALVAEMRFDFLLDRRREVFYLGYHVSEERVDEGHYDLLASEARIASLVAIAKGEAPRSHWLHLGRPLTRVDGLRMLLSWNGSMFEYLMPILYMRRYEGMLLSQTYEAAVLRQIAYARSKGVPWGISESGYYSFDAERNYQYRGFGVPGMGRKRGLGDDLVVAPYASLLAVTINPKEVVRNVAHLKREEMLGSYGFYEAIDYTKTRLPPGQKKARVLSFMAHHQGMSLVALTNYLTEEALVERFHRIPMIQTVELLLQEQVPAAAPIEEATEQLAGALPTAEGEVDIGPWTPDPNAQAPQVHYLSNGRYGVLLSTSGGGFSCWGDVQITRWRADPTLDNWGSWLYLQDRETGHIWSLTRQPLGAATNQQCRFYAH
ncbi:MAG: hypothetical protein H5T69_07750, partial [Chloroflexi bacterium]|nr:hypothetical protein [Chloroflexota bacterium]